MGNSDFTRMCSTADRPGFAAPSMRFEVLMEGLVPIRLKHHDKNSTTTQQLEISLVMPEEIPFSQE